MRAFLLTGSGPVLTDVPDPVPGPGQVVVEVDAAGLCHSDLTLMARPAEAHPFDLPVILGHELAGTVVEVPAGVTGLRVGDAVVGYGPRGCERCASCSAGAENYCRQAPPAVFPPGLGAHGALADYVAVDARHLLLAPGVPAVQAAALSDAGLTAFHALNRAVASGACSQDATVVVIGIGGLGHAALQLARVLGAGVVAVDRSRAKLALARTHGAHHALVSGPELADEVREITAGRGADVVLDLVASQETLTQAGRMLAVDGVLSIVGVGAGRLPVGMHALPLGARTDLPYWGTRPELVRLLQLAASERIRMEVEEIPLGAVADAYARLAAGAVAGRAVARPRLLPPTQNQ